MKCIRSHKEVKKVIWDANSKAYDDLYSKLWTWQGEIFNLAKMSERKSRDLDHARCVKSEDQKVLGKDNGIKER